MGDQEASLIDHKHGSHLLLDQPLLRLPLELLKNNFRSAHYTYEKESTYVKTLLRETGTGAVNGKASPENVVKNLDAMLVRMRGMKRKLATYATEEARIYKQVDARVAHLRELSDMHSVEDVKYETWSRQRLDRLLVDYLLRNGYDRTATALAEERGMQDLVDVDTFLAASKIREALLDESVQEALAWCSENKKELRKMNSNLEFMLRCQQFVEMIRTEEPKRLTDAILHARRFIVPYQAAYPDDVHQIAGLLAYRQGTDLEPYASWFSPRRWHYLADLFVTTHNTLLGLPPFPLLHTALSLGLSALKTPACHSATNQRRRHPAAAAAAPAHGTTSLTTNVCPICSTELNELARHVPYAHHTKSHVEHDLMLLPNARVYGKARLEEYATKAGLAPGMVKDPVTGDLFTWDKLKKVFIT